MTLKQLQYFKKISETLSFTKAAQELYISQPSLSFTIKELEAELNTQLFIKNPSTGRIMLSETGAIFLKYVDSALTSIQDGFLSVQHYNEVAHKILNIGYIHTFPLQKIKELFRNYQKDCGDTDIDLRRNIYTSNSMLHNQIKSNRLSFAFCLSLSDGLDGVIYDEQELFVAVSKNHSLSKKSSVSFEDITKEPIVRIPHAIEVNSRVDALYASFGKEPVIMYLADHMNAALAYVMDTNCISIVPKTALSDTTDLKFLAIKDRPLFRPIYFAWKKNYRLNTNEKKFRDYVIRNCISNK
ncbi:MAG: LysR family transcriptional regulator [Lachnospiraceae bacterium]|nr:LysR family transcriptional regulator [Candidatus Minthocola equi]